MSECKELQRDRAYKLIKDAILNHELKPGQLLQEQDMVEKFRMGRTPLREALQRLTSEGLLQSMSRKGIFVTIMSTEDVRNIFELRSDLDAFAARLAAKRASESEIMSLENILSDPDFNEENKTQFDEKVHRAIAKCAHNVELEKTLNVLYVKSICMFSMEGYVRESVEDMKNELREIIDQIKLRNPEGASAAAFKHVESRNWFQ